MQKALLISILGATVLIPLFAARAATLKQAVKRSVVATVAFCVAYWVALLVVYPKLPQPNKTPSGQAAH